MAKTDLMVKVNIEWKDVIEIAIIHDKCIKRLKAVKYKNYEPLVLVSDVEQVVDDMLDEIIESIEIVGDKE